MKAELKKAYIDRVNELLGTPAMEAKIQISYRCDEVPTIRYDIVERIIPKNESEESE